MTFKSPVVTLICFVFLLTHHLGHFTSLFRYLQASFLSLGNLSYFFFPALCLQVQIRCVFTRHLSQHIFNCLYLLVGLPQWLNSKELSARQEKRFQSLGGTSPGEGNGNPLQYSCLENPMDRGTWQVTE